MWRAFLQRHPLQMWNRSFELPLPFSSSPTKKKDNMKPHISKQGNRLSVCDGLRSFKFRQIFIFNRWLVLYIFFSLTLRGDDLGVQYLIWSFETRVCAQFKVMVQRRRNEVPFERMPETKKREFTQCTVHKICFLLRHQIFVSLCPVVPQSLSRLLFQFFFSLHQAWIKTKKLRVNFLEYAYIFSYTIYCMFKIISVENRDS